MPSSRSTSASSRCDVVVEIFVRHAGLDARARPLAAACSMRASSSRERFAGAVAAHVRARDVAAVAVALRARVDEQRACRRATFVALVRDVVQHRRVRAERDDVLVRRRRIVLLASPRDTRGGARARCTGPPRNICSVAAMAAHRAPRRLGEALDLVRGLLRAHRIERGEQRRRVDLARRRLRPDRA